MGGLWYVEMKLLGVKPWSKAFVEVAAERNRFFSRSPLLRRRSPSLLLLLLMLPPPVPGLTVAMPSFATIPGRPDTIKDLYPHPHRLRPVS